MASMTVSDFLLQRLREWGVKRVFGYPGDGINGIMGAFNRAENKPEFILARHEELAAFMACGHAKFTGEVGVCVATSGPGAVHLLNGLYDAKLDHQPVVAIVGQQNSYSIGGSFQQEIDLQSLYKDVAADYVTTITTPAQLPDALDRAVRIALSQRTVTCLIIPHDVQNEDAVEKTPHKHGYVPGGLGYVPPRVVPPESELERAAKVLNEGKRVAMLIGQGARGAADEVKEVAELLGCGVAKALLGKDVLPDTLTYVTGSIGLLGTRPTWEMIADCDTFLMVGSSMPYYEFLPKAGQARAVQIDISGKMIGIRYPMEVNLVGDAKETLRALLPHLRRKADRTWRDKIEASVHDWWQVMEARAHDKADPVNPQLVAWAANDVLPDDAIVTTDSGSAANWFARYVKIKDGMRASLSGTLATMGPGVPYAIAAKFAFPSRPVVAMVGDGAMQMNGINGLITISQYWQRWADPRLVVMVLHNNDLNQVTWEMRVMEGDTRFEPSQFITDFPYAGYAEMLGLKGIRVDRPEFVGPAWDEAMKSDRPVVFEALTDPNVPPLPPHITVEQAKEFSAALLKRDPEARQMVVQAIRSKMSEYFPGRKG